MSFDHSEIYSHAKFYDLINDFDFDLPFLSQYVLANTGKTLELGCGTGRVAIPMAKKGAKIVGLDISKEMLLEAKLKAKKENVNVEFIKSDIIDFDLNEKFNLIYCFHNTISHINGIENLRKFFNSIKRHLQKDGIFLLQVFNPDFFFFTRNPEEKFLLKTFVNPENNEKVELSESNYYDDESQINYIKWTFSSNGKEIVKNWNQRVYFPQELDYITQLMGFQILEKFGDFDKTPFEENPETQVIICKINEEC